MKEYNYNCPKCGNKQYDLDEFRATGGTLTKLFNIQSKHFTTISCSRCHYTELYKTTSSKFENVVDFFFN